MSSRLNLRHKCRRQVEPPDWRVGAVLGSIAGILVLTGLITVLTKLKRKYFQNRSPPSTTGHGRPTGNAAGAHITSQTRTTPRHSRTMTTNPYPSRHTRAVTRVVTDTTLPPYVAHPEPVQLPPVILVPELPPPPYPSNASNMVFTPIYLGLSTGTY
ncbi:hypothetical protein VNI00_004514 [Paramarasmius palmivorus]|uniref:Uncharacterized protein n=1 Tax=Paramarasmius palmivorus TaxID=297713 RepID=A0AAW0DIY4_9AGAR